MVHAPLLDKRKAFSHGLNQVHLKSDYDFLMRRLPAFPLLRAFEAAAHAQSFTKAAQELHLTPSAISHQVKELEEFLGRRLFTRLHRRIELTPEGHVLADRLAGLFNAIAAACEEVSAPSNWQVLTIHSAPSFATKWLSPRLRLFAETHPSIAITITSTAEPVDLTKDRLTDVCISYGRAIRKDGLSVYALGEEEIAPMVSPSARARFESGEDVLYGLPLIFSPLSNLTWEQWFQEHEMESPRGRRLSLDRASLGISAAADGLGVVLESVRLAEPELASGALVRLDATDCPSTWAATHFLSARTYDLEQPKVQSFAQWLLAQAEVPDKL